MAVVPYGQGVPTVALSGAPANDYLNISPDAGAFGAQQGQQLQRTGAELDQASTNAAQIAIARQTRYNQIAVQEAQNGLSDLMFAKLYKDPATGADGIYAKKGADALSAFQPTMDAINDGRNSIRDGLRNDAQRLAFDTESRYYINRERDRIGEHVATQVSAYGVATNTAGLSNVNRTIAADPLSDETWNQSVQKGLSFAARLIQDKGLGNDPNASESAKAGVYAQAATTRIDALNGLHPGSGTKWAKTAQFQDGTPVWGSLPATEQQRLGKLGQQDDAASVANKEYTGLTASSENPVVRNAVVSAAKAQGVPVDQAVTIAHIESHTGTVPDREGSQYKGVFQLGDKERANVGLGENAPPTEQAEKGVQHLAGAYRAATNAVGAPAQGWQTYMVHQQGSGGGVALLKADPNASALQTILPSYRGDVATATQALTGNGGSASMTVGQFLGVWQKGYAEAAGVVGANPGMPSTNDAPLPLSGNAILAAESRIRSSGLEDEAQELAVNKFRTQVAGYNQAIQANANIALDQIGTQLLRDRLSVPDEAILNNGALNLTQKQHLLTLKQNSIKSVNQEVENSAVNVITAKLLESPGSVTDEQITLHPDLDASHRVNLFNLKRALIKDAEADYSTAFRVSEKNAEDTLGAQIIAAPAGISEAVINSNPSLSLTAKTKLLDLRTHLLSRAVQGDGAPYADAYQMVFAPPGTPGRINTLTDVLPLAAKGLTISGFDKIEKAIKLRDAPGGTAIAAALPTWTKMIERTTKENPTSFMGAISTTPAQALSAAHFKSDLPGLIADAQAKNPNMSMAQIVGAGGPIEKILPNYILSTADKVRSLAGVGAAPPLAQAATAPAVALQASPPQFQAGRWYSKSGEVPPGTPGALYFTGGDYREQANWTKGPTPQAPH